MYKILVVEDESQISSIVIKYLKKNGFECQVAKNGFEALEKFNKKYFHIIILDIMMPGIDGFEVLQRIREISDVPVIMLTAKQEEIDRLKGFENGADDYVTKPFSPRELVKRVRVFIKRIYNQENEIIIKSRELELHTASMKLYKNNRYIELTSTEFKLLHTLMQNMNQILTREQLIQKAFGIDYNGFDRNIDSYIKRIRKKIESNTKQPIYLKTKYGQGYVFDGGDSK